MSEIEKFGPAAFDRAVGAVGSASVTLVLGLVFGPAPTALVGAATGPYIEEFSSFARQAVLRQIGRVQRAIDVAVDYGSTDVDTLVGEALANDLKLELATRGFNAAATSTINEKIDALGRALASGLLAEDDAIVHEEFQIISALAQIDAPEIRLLQVMEIPRENDQHWSRDLIAMHDPGLASTVDALLARVSAQGLVASPMVVGAGGWPPWKLTEFGELCLRALRDREQGRPRS